MTTINSLPPEIIRIILGHLDNTKPWQYYQHHLHSLLQCALVTTSWTSPALDLLYHVIDIDSWSKAILFRSWTKRHYIENTKLLRIGGITWTAELEVILRACANLKELYLACGLREVPLNVLQYSSLQNLRKLDLHCSFSESSTFGQHLLSNQIATPDHLEFLSVHCYRKTVPVLHNLARKCVAGRRSELKELSVYDEPQHTAVLLPLASTLTSLFFARFEEEYSSINCVTYFLEQAVSLTRFNFEVVTATQLTQVLSSLKCRLHTFRLTLSGNMYTDGKIFDVLRQALSAKTSVLRSLELMRFSGCFGAHEVESIEGWNEVCHLLSRNRTQVLIE